MKQRIKLGRLLFLVCLSITTISYAQDGTKDKTIDPSKPTNLYTQVNLNMEYQKRSGADVWGPG